MKIPRVSKRTVMYAAVVTKRTGKQILNKAVTYSLQHEPNIDKVMSTVMAVSSLIPRYDAKMAQMARNFDHQEFVPTVNKTAKKISTAVKILTPKTAATTKIMAKGQVQNSIKLNILFNSLLLENDMQKNPLNNKACIFIKSAKKHGVDPTVLMAIAMHESARGTSNATKVKRNIGGIMTSKQKLKHFSNIDLCIDQMAETLAYHHRENKINTVKELAEAGKYCGKSEAKEWIKNVMYYLNELQ